MSKSITTTKTMEILIESTEARYEKTHYEWNVDLLTECVLHVDAKNVYEKSNSLEMKKNEVESNKDQH